MIVIKWVRKFNYGRTNVNDKGWSGRPSEVNDDMVKKFVKTDGFVRMFSDEFPQKISKTVLHEVVIDFLNYQ